MVEVTQEDANNYCRVLTALGMEEEGDPADEIERLQSEVCRLRAAIRVRGPGVSDAMRGEIAYQLTKRLVIDMPTARAGVDAAMRQLELTPNAGVKAAAEGSPATEGSEP
jgi:hypothetical protein